MEQQHSSPSAVYELTYILRPTLTDDEVGIAAEAIVEDLTSAGAVVDGMNDFLGKRRLAYQIDGYQDGHYVVLTSFLATLAQRKAIDRRMRERTAVLRHITIRKDDL